MAALAVVLIVTMRVLYPLPAEIKAVASAAFPASEATRLGASILPVAARHPGKSAVLALADGRDAFAALGEALPGREGLAAALG